MDDIFLLTEVNRQFKIEIAYENRLPGLWREGQRLVIGIPR